VPETVTFTERVTRVLRRRVALAVSVAGMMLCADSKNTVAWAAPCRRPKPTRMRQKDNRRSDAGQAWGVVSAGGAILSGLC
jgi:hypothetical protein